MKNNKSNIIQYPEVRIVEASAGSGKTYKLAKRYLQLLMNKNTNPEYLKSILAITFTNKASREMKERILDFLKMIALDAFPDSDSKKEILSSLNLGESGARAKARQIMDYIVSNYENFCVQTIDSFVKSILSNCAYSFRLPLNFEIKKDSEDGLHYSLDNYIDKANQNKDIHELIDGFISQYLYLENKNSWFPKRDILKLLKELFKYTSSYGKPFKRYDLGGFNVVKEKKKILYIFRKIREELKEGVNKRFLNTLDKFLKENEEVFDFQVFKEKTYLARVDIPVNKGHELEEGVQRQWKQLQDLISKIAEKEAFSIFNYYIIMFEQVYKGFRQYAKKEETLFLQEINEQASMLMQENAITVPELYYRLAVRYRHYLIDEFQDTSFLQWENLFLMIEEALSAGGTLFYVGDKKQAIFRFRGGDLALFDEVKDVFKVFNVKKECLDVNYRSQKNIIEFNNNVFSSSNLREFVKSQTNASSDGLRDINEKDVDEIISNYTDSKQEGIIGRDGGCVEAEYVEYFDAEDKEQVIKDKVIKQIYKIKERFDLGNIAVLCRENEEIELVSNWLIENGIAVESEKTLNIRNNSAIKELISFLKFLNSPIDDLSFASFILGDIFIAACGMKKSDCEHFILENRPKSQENKSANLYREFRKKYPVIWSEYIEKFFKNIGFISPYELIVDILNQFKVLSNFPKMQGFICHFLELAKKAEEEYQSIDDFLEYFEKIEGNDLYVKFQGSSGTVKVTTMHKAKGLGFGVVIIPFLEMDANRLGPARRGSNLPHAIRSKDNDLSLVRLDSKYAKLSPKICALYKNEYIKAFKDELNVMYVAFTRAKYEIYIFIPCSKKKDNNIARYFIPEKYMKLGKKSVYKKDSHKQTEGISITIPEYKNWIDYLKDEFTEYSKLERRKSLIKGRVLHCILSYIGNVGEGDKDEILNAAVKQAEYEFPFIEDFKIYKSSVKALLDAKEMNKFFYLSDAAVYNEKEIVDSFGVTKRVDRLIVKGDEVWVIDYKGRGEVISDYKKQLKNYMRIMKDIYPDKTVKGFIIFIEDLRTEEIDE